MEWIVFGGIMAATAALIAALFGQRRKMFNEPVFLIELGKKPGWSFREGTLNANLSKGDGPRATGSFKGRTLRVCFEYQQQFNGHYSASNPGRNINSGSSMEDIETIVETGIELSKLWRGIELHEQSIDVIRDDITGADQPIGDPGFDDDFILTGDVTDELRKRLLDGDVQRALRSFDEPILIRDGFILLRQSIEGTAIKNLEEKDIRQVAAELTEVAKLLDGDDHPPATDG